MLERLEIFRHVLKSLVEEAQIIEEFLLRFVHDLELGDGLFELARGKVSHVHSLVTLPEQAHDLDAKIRAALGLLQVLDRLAVLSSAKKTGTELVTQFIIGLVAIDPFAGLADEDVDLRLLGFDQLLTILLDVRVLGIFINEALERFEVVFINGLPDLCDLFLESGVVAAEVKGPLV